jgi:hypothetical protein
LYGRRKLTAHLCRGGLQVAESTVARCMNQFLAYFTTGRANNGGTEAINGIIELHRRAARGFRNPTNYRPRVNLAAGRLTRPESPMSPQTHAPTLDQGYAHSQPLVGEFRCALSGFVVDAINPRRKAWKGPLAPSRCCQTSS